MKTNRLLFLFAIVIAFSSCSKQNELEATDKTEKLYPVNLSVSTFNTEIVGLTSSVGSSRGTVSATTSTNATSSMADVIGNLDYVIYNASGIMVKTATQLNTLSTFGTISEQLPAGSYQVYVAGTDGASVLSKDKSTTAMVSANAKTGEIFMKALNIKVGDSTFSQSLVLDRMVGKLEVKIADTIPRNIYKITVTSSSGSWIYLNSTNDRYPQPKSVDNFLSTSDYGKINYTAGLYIVPNLSGSITSDVSIRAYNTAGGLVVDKIVKDVKVETNKKTILTGKLFTTTTSPTTGFAVSISADWKTDSNNVSF
jgi:hypothetical protein